MAIEFEVIEQPTEIGFEIVTGGWEAEPELDSPKGDSLLGRARAFIEKELGFTPKPVGTQPDVPKGVDLGEVDMQKLQETRDTKALQLTETKGGEVSPITTTLAETTTALATGFISFIPVALNKAFVTLAEGGDERALEIGEARSQELAELITFVPHDPVAQEAVQTIGHILEWILGPAKEVGKIAGDIMAENPIIQAVGLDRFAPWVEFITRTGGELAEFGLLGRAFKGVKGKLTPKEKAKIIIEKIKDGEQPPIREDIIKQAQEEIALSQRVRKVIDLEEKFEIDSPDIVRKKNQIKTPQEAVAIEAGLSKTKVDAKALDVQARFDAGAISVHQAYTEMSALAKFSAEDIILRQKERFGVKSFEETTKLKEKLDKIDESIEVIESPKLEKADIKVVEDAWRDGSESPIAISQRTGFPLEKVRKITDRIDGEVLSTKGNENIKAEVIDKKIKVDEPIDPRITPDLIEAFNKAEVLRRKAEELQFILEKGPSDLTIREVGAVRGAATKARKKFKSLLKEKTGITLEKAIEFDRIEKKLRKIIKEPC